MENKAFQKQTETYLRTCRAQSPIFSVGVLYCSLITKLGKMHVLKERLATEYPDYWKSPWS